MFFATEEVRKAHALPEGWQAFRVAVIGRNGSHVELEGGVYPDKFDRGPRKGTPNYKKPAPGTECTIVLSMAEYRRMVSVDAPARGAA